MSSHGTTSQLHSILRTLHNRYTRTKGRAAVSVIAAVGVLVLYRRLQKSNDEATSGDGFSRKQKKKEHGVDGRFLIRLAKLLPVLVPGLRSREALTLALQTCALISRSVLSIHIAEITGKGLEAVARRDGKLFLSSIADFVVTGVTASVVNSGLKFMTNILGAWFVENLTHHIHKTYLNKKNYYFVSAHPALADAGSHTVDGEAAPERGTALDNVDHRLVVDVDNFAKQLADLYSRTFKPALDVVLCTARLGTSLKGYSGPILLYTYFLGISAAIRATSPPMSKLVAHQQTLDGNYRRAQARLVSHHEEIAFLNGGAAEERLLNDRLASASGWKEKLAAIQFRQGCIDQFGLKYFASVVGWPVIALPFITEGAPKDGKDQLRRLTQYRVADNLIQTSSASLCDLILTYKKVQTLAGYTARVSELIEALNRSDEQHTRRMRMPSPEKTHEESQEDAMPDAAILAANDLTITTPDKCRILLDGFNFVAKPGDRVLITGPNGAGKTSLFRVLAGLWPASAGGIRINKTLSSGALQEGELGDIRIMYLPQSPYLVLGTLRDQVMYPTITDVHPDDSFVIECLERVGLGRLLSTYSLDTEVWEWADVLSGGERQRIGWARLLYHRPSVVVLDEATSAIAVDDEAPLYELLIGMNPGMTIFSIAHRPSLRRLHTCELHIDGDGYGHWTLKRLDEATISHDESVNVEMNDSVETVDRTTRSPIGLFGAEPSSP
ncbi:Proteases secretion ATP-binding protein prtD, putative [Perkinsus marinus ATCC 50983]|uniref:Proteases secretion ATP-binding protein prtD, putative n=1 Tax=Perkinsus marinus (strain ATCC 50983 / TXsc) TaxID=423536 RepID=C5KCH0_PERM5|nr:Proteases secretion ATP-binding protein prtD, putative [Perkinsus marinus ATCC 50983]EER17832.1 Proteases secretion ATP-binding protein prtD, putative [Perkinsus marinus ATCC 50983]|eukprot:XP_002786036.1 Proteases secretion ATP-binding protein prtD, putative [Perkinsus marinus ATCC 50983]